MSFGCVTSNNSDSDLRNFLSYTVHVYYKLSEPDIFLHLNAFQKFIKAKGNRFLLKKKEKNTQQIVILNFEIIILLTALEMT